MLTPVYQDWSGGGAGQGVGVNVTAVGLDIRIMICLCLCLYVMLPGWGWGVKTGADTRFGVGGGGWVEISSSLASCQQLASKKKISNQIIGGGRWGGGR